MPKKQKNKEEESELDSETSSGLAPEDGNSSDTKEEIDEAEDKELNAFLDLSSAPVQISTNVSAPVLERVEQVEPINLEQEITITPVKDKKRSVDYVKASPRDYEISGTTRESVDYEPKMKAPVLKSRQDLREPAPSQLLDPMQGRGIPQQGEGYPEMRQPGTLRRDTSLPFEEETKKYKDFEF